MDKESHEPWREVLVDELSDESEDERRDFQDADRNPFESEHGPAMGTDGDDDPVYARPKDTRVGTSGRTARVKLTNGKTATFEIFEQGDIVDTVRVKPKTNPAGEIVDGGHGFIVSDPRSRPWKTARRTHCAYCGDELPTPKVTATKYRCEFDVEFVDCQCSGCTLRHLVVSGYERNKGQPRMCCTAECTRLRDNERGRWQRAVARAIRSGHQPPPEPADRGASVTAAKRPHRLASTQERFPARHDMREAKSAVVPWTVPFWAADPWLKFFRAGAVPIGAGSTTSYPDPVGSIASVNADGGPLPESTHDGKKVLSNAA
ncbi:hypothetical protein OG976_04775 [Mycobacterium sp. NBC_00419]|uniref:hypothetical protein n=1 Tax=Mycobacterium sp. NBC_00419 TaxID=2975989 RepID=UPI002E21A479